MNDSYRGEALGVSIESRFEDSPWQWFVRGTLIGMLMMAAVNALSYFVRSADWAGLVGPRKLYDESLGFPLVIWEVKNSYGGMFVDYASLGWNLLFAASAGSVLGLFAARQTNLLNSLIQRMQLNATQRVHQPIQFSLRGMLVVTAIVAVASMLAKEYAARSETLIAIYAMGPIVLVVIAMLPRRLEWQKRVMIIIPATLTLIAIAMVVGVSLGMEFDKVMMGIFLCWTPQSVIAAVGLTAWLLVAEMCAS